MINILKKKKNTLIIGLCDSSVNCSFCLIQLTVDFLSKHLQTIQARPL